MVVFVADSKQLVDRRFPFDSKEEYRRLVGWMGRLELAPIEVVMVDHKDPMFERVVEKWPDAVIGLGVHASQAVGVAGGLCYSLPHPRGRNTILKNKRYVNRAIKDCKQWLKGRI